jgi:hypothetical protein
MNVHAAKSYPHVGKPTLSCLRDGMKEGVTSERKGQCSRKTTLADPWIGTTMYDSAHLRILVAASIQPPHTDILYPLQ